MFAFLIAVDGKSCADYARICETQSIRSSIDTAISHVAGEEMDHVPSSLRSAPMSQTENMPRRHQGEKKEVVEPIHSNEFSFLFPFSVGEYFNHVVELDFAVGFRFVQTNLFARGQSSRLHVFLRYKPSSHVLYCTRKVIYQFWFSDEQIQKPFII